MRVILVKYIIVSSLVALIDSLIYFCPKIYQRETNAFLYRLHGKKSNYDQLVSMIEKGTLNHDINNVDTNKVATNLISLGMKRGDIKYCEEIFHSVDKNNIADVVTHNAIMSAYISVRRFHDAMRILNAIKKKQLILDTIGYSSAIRIIYAIKPWKFTMDLLDEAFQVLGEKDSLLVLHTLLTDMKISNKIRVHQSSPSILTQATSNETSTVHFMSDFDSNITPVNDINDSTSTTTTTTVNSSTAVYSPSAEILRHRDDCISWCRKYNITPISQTLDLHLSLSCVYGQLSDVIDSLNLRKEWHIPPTPYTLNILIEYYITQYSDRYKKDASYVFKLLLQLLHEWDICPDAITINTVLKGCLHVDDMITANIVIDKMKNEWKVAPNSWTIESLLLIYGRQQLFHDMHLVLNTIPTTEWTSRMITNYIKYHTHLPTCEVILKHAFELNRVEPAIISYMIDKYLQKSLYSQAHDFIQTYLDQHFPIDKYVVSVLLKVVFQECNDLYERNGQVINKVYKFNTQHYETIQSKLAVLQHYLQHIQMHHPALLTEAVCQKVMKECIILKCYDIAAMIHIQYFPTLSCKKDILTAIFQGLQDLSTSSIYDETRISQKYGQNIHRNKGVSHELTPPSLVSSIQYSHMKYRGQLARQALSLFYMYASPQSTTTEIASITKLASRSGSSSSNGNKYPSKNIQNMTNKYSESTEYAEHIVEKEGDNKGRRIKSSLLRTSQLNNLVRLLNLANMNIHVEKLFHLVTCNRYLQTPSSTSTNMISTTTPTTTSMSMSNNTTSDSSGDSTEKNRRQKLLSQMSTDIQSMYQVDTSDEDMTTGIDCDTDTVTSSSSSPSTINQSSSSVSSVSSSLSPIDLNLTPTLFTIAELLRSARTIHSSILARGAMLWGISEATYMPIDILRDAISYLYSEGQIEMVSEVYERAYEANYIQHWLVPPTFAAVAAASSSSTNVTPPLLTTAIDQDIIIIDREEKEIEDDSTYYYMDLHYFSKGMAYAAITCAIKELQKKYKTATSSSTPSHTNDDNHISRTKTLIIIAGQNIHPTASTSTMSPSQSSIKSTSSVMNTGEKMIGKLEDVIDELITQKYYRNTDSESSSSSVSSKDNNNNTVGSGINTENIRPRWNTLSQKDTIKNNGKNRKNYIQNDNNDQTNTKNTLEMSYRLISEIQTILIEDFYPPISSSTVPGNPGRLYITIPI